jgi:transposase InsO family protein
VLKSPPCSPTANSICERVIGTIRRECLDWLIPLSESHLRFILKSWITHYNTGRPYMALGPGLPDSSADIEHYLRTAGENRFASHRAPYSFSRNATLIAFSRLSLPKKACLDMSGE